MSYWEFAGWAVDTGLLVTGLVLAGIWFTVGFMFGRRSHDCPLPEMRVVYTRPDVDPVELRARIVAGHRPARLSER